MRDMAQLGLVALLAIGLTCPVFAQSQAPRAPANLPPDALPDDVVVEGYRERPDIQTHAKVPVAVSTTRNRQTYEHSEQLAKCAARSKLSDLKRLRAVVDGEFNTATMLLAQDRLKRIYVSCSEGAGILENTKAPQSDMEQAALFDGQTDFLSRAGSFAADAAPLGYSIYDRGAFTIQALKLFAPDLKLTRAETGDPQVQSRFNLREVPRNRLRLREDYDYFAIAVCMVRVEPRLSVRLAMSDGSARFGDVQAALIDRARICVGGAKNVQVDPTQFRLYIADAVYRWAVAARGVDSLIPEKRG